MIDPNNPYVNNNLDADLGKVLRGGELGKHKLTRKQINTSQFQLDAGTEEKDRSDRQKNSDNDSTRDRTRSDRMDAANKK